MAELAGLPAPHNLKGALRPANKPSPDLLALPERQFRTYLITFACDLVLHTRIAWCRCSWKAKEHTAACYSVSAWIGCTLMHTCAWMYISQNACIVICNSRTTTRPRPVGLGNMPASKHPGQEQLATDENQVVLWSAGQLCPDLCDQMGIGVIFAGIWGTFAGADLKQAGLNPCVARFLSIPLQVSGLWH